MFLTASSCRRILAVGMSPPFSTTFQTRCIAVKVTSVVNTGAIPELIFTVIVVEARFKSAPLFPQTKNCLLFKTVGLLALLRLLVS